MPELPEVETTKRGIIPHLIAQSVIEVVVRQHQLRWRIPGNLMIDLPGQRIHDVTRRGKYLLIHVEKGVIIIHLGMSGHLRILPADAIGQKHDHVDILLSNNYMLRYTDPRRFGAVLWTTENPFSHPLLISLGPEPLSKEFTGAYLFQEAQNRKIAVKLFIMDSHNIVGVGNIYANEALFLAGINPAQPVNKISLQKYQLLAQSIKKVLSAAIKSGGTTLRNFFGSEGKPGYFKQKLYVYGRAGEKCKKCESILKEIRLGQRSTVFCPKCQRKQ